MMDSTDIVRLIAALFDVAALLLASGGAAFFITKRDAVPRSNTITGLVMMAIIAGAVLTGCSAPQNKPVEESPEARSVRLCVDMMYTFCDRAAECGYSGKRACYATARECVHIRGITEEEAASCNRAMKQAPCDSTEPPDACLEIADAAPTSSPPSAPQPKEQEL